MEFYRISITTYMKWIGQKFELLTTLHRTFTIIFNFPWVMPTESKINQNNLFFSAKSFILFLECHKRKKYCIKNTQREFFLCRVFYIFFLSRGCFPVINPTVMEVRNKISQKGFFFPRLSSGIFQKYLTWAEHELESCLRFLPTLNISKKA